MTSDPQRHRYFEDYAIGDRFSTETYTLTRAEIVAFAEHYDPQAIHLDDAAARDGFFGALTSSGWLTAALSMRLFIRAGIMPDRGAVGAGLDRLRWTHPVYPGDTLRVDGQILRTKADARRHIGHLRIEMKTYNQHDRVVMTQIALCLIDRRPQA